MEKDQGKGNPPSLFPPTFDSLKNKVHEALLHFKDLKNEVLSLFAFYRDLAEAL
jgi:hypothetical protein